CDEFSLSLLAANQVHLIFRLSLSQEVVYPCLAGDCRRGKRIIAGDHYRLDSHLPKLFEPLAHSPLNYILEVDYSERSSVLGNSERRTPIARNPLNLLFQVQ